MKKSVKNQIVKVKEWDRTSPTITIANNLANRLLIGIGSGVLVILIIDFIANV